MAAKTETKNVVTEEVRFPIEKLRAHCTELFGIQDFAFDGAAYGLEGEYTVEEMRKIIKEWLRKEIK